MKVKGRALLIVLALLFAFALSPRNVSAQGYFIRTYIHLFGDIHPTEDGGIVMSTEDGVAKLHPSTGEVDWNRVYTSRLAHSVIADNSGAFISAGYSDASSALLKLDALGNEQWERHYAPGEEVNFIRSAPILCQDIPTTSSCPSALVAGLYLVGGPETGYLSGGVSVGLAVPGGSSVQPGEIIWRRLIVPRQNNQYHIGFSQLVDVQPILQSSNTGVATTKGYVTLARAQTGITPNSTSGEFTYWVARMDLAGNLLWDKVYHVGAGVDETPSAIRPTADGGFIIAGSIGSGITSSTDFWLIKTDSYGTIVWERTYGTTAQDFAQSVEQTPDAGYLVTGVGGPGGAIVLKLDANGLIQWQRMYHPPGGAYATSGVPLVDGFLVGATAKAGYPDIQGVVMKLDKDGNVPNCSLLTDPQFGTYAVSASVGSGSAVSTDLSTVPGTFTAHLQPNPPVVVVATICGESGSTFQAKPPSPRSSIICLPFLTPFGFSNPLVVVAIRCFWWIPLFAVLIAGGFLFSRPRRRKSGFARSRVL